LKGFAVKHLWFLCIALALQLLSPSARSAAPGDGTDSAREIVTQLEAAWNRHDMAAYGALFHDDAEWVNVVGMHWRGKAEVMKAHTAFHETIFKNCQLHGEAVSVRKVAPGTVVAVWAHRQDAYATPSGNQQAATFNRLTLVVTQRDGRWHISHGHNVWVNERAARSNPVLQP